MKDLALPTPPPGDQPAAVTPIGDARPRLRPVDAGVPGHIVITADVPWPVWDQHAGVVVMPSALSRPQAAAAMVELVRERIGGAA
jgi:hypothetical protein